MGCQVRRASRVFSVMGRPEATDHTDGDRLGVAPERFSSGSRGRRASTSARRTSPPADSPAARASSCRVQRRVGQRSAYSANISCSVCSTSVTARSCSRPTRFAKRLLSTVRIWSTATKPVRRWKRHGTRHGYTRPPVVIGATMVVRRCRLSSSGEMIRQGLVFRISLSVVGSRLTRWTSPRAGLRRATTSTPARRSCSDASGRATRRHLTCASARLRPPSRPAGPEQP